MRKMLQNVTLLAMIMLLSGGLFAQVTTSGINGKVLDSEDAGLFGATVVVKETMTGFEYGTITDARGNYHLPNLNPGGPYTLVISYVGFQSFTKPDIYLELGQTLRINQTLNDAATELTGVEIISTRSDVFDGNRTGAETVVDNKTLQRIPSVTGSLSDYTKLSPQVSNVGSGISIAGMNNRFNSVMIDGTINNDVFGLAANGMNGGQTGINAISSEAIDQVQIVVAPYDVRMSGFAGGGINAITKRGTNKFHGAVYFKYRNQNFAGKTPGAIDDGEKREKLDDFTAKTVGFTLGGPIIKNKLFFFLNYENQNDETPRPFDINDYTGDASPEQLQALSTFLQNNYDYDPGGFGNSTSSLKGQKILTRFDLNINKNHKLMARYQYVNAESTSPGRSNSNNINFANSGVLFPSTTHTAALELKSVFGSKYSNNLKLSLTAVKDDRNVMGNKFPGVAIDDGAGTINFGGEVYSTGNLLEQNIISISDNFQIYKGNHVITIGTHNEFYDIYNMFMRKAYGEYDFNSLDDFMSGAPSSYYTVGYSLIDDIRGDGSAAAADFNAFQFGFYIQDEWQFRDNVKFTAGLRVDIPMFLDDPAEIPGFNDSTVAKLEEHYDLKGARSGSMPKSQLLWSPRIGFNWDVFSDKTLQVRGGSGIFTSRIPFVWPAGSYTNNGMVIGSHTEYGTELFNPDPNTQTIGGTEAGSGSQIDIYAEDFKFPQIWRTNLALDAKLPGGVVGTIEFIYSKTLNNVLWKDVNVKDPIGNATGTPDDRPIYKTYKNGIESNYGQIMLGDNTNEGYTYSVTTQLKKEFDFGLYTSFSYTYGKSESVFDGTSSQNSSQWNYLVSSPTPRNDAQLAISDFDLGHRVVGMLAYEAEYINHLKTSVSVFYNGQTGRPMSYIYDDYRGNFTNEAYKGPQLIYIPENQSDIIFVGEPAEQQAQWDDLDAFIEQDDYLSANRGSYAERNASRLPWANIFDVRLAQDVFVTTGKDFKHTLQITFDVFNFGNMINPEWGNKYFAANNNVGLIKYEGMITDEATGDNTTPTFSFDRPADDQAWYLNDGGLYSSRWQAMIGVRYKF